MSHRNKPASPRPEPLLTPVWWAGCVLGLGLLGMAIFFSVRGSQPKTSSADLTAQARTNSQSVRDINTNAVAAYNAANAALAREDYREALALYQGVLQHKADDEEAYFGLGVTFTRMRKKDEAIDAYRKALEIYPQYAEAHNNLGNLLLHDKRFNEAVEHFRSAIEHSPDNPSGHNNLGNALAWQGKIHEALPHFLEAVRLDPKYAEAFFNLGNAYQNEGQVQRAIIAYEKAYQLNPHLVVARSAAERLRRIQEAGPSSRK